MDLRSPLTSFLPKRLLLGPGPSNVAPSVLAAMASPLVSHLDPFFLKIMEEVQQMLRKVFQTSHEMTFPASGTGSAGMEFCFTNLIEPGDEVLICVNGLFGERMVDMASRLGAIVRRIEAPWGQPIDPTELESVLRERPFKLVAVVHAETSTGVRNPVETIGRLVHENGALFLVDTVTSLGGMEVNLDAWGVDAAFSGTQKCLSCPPGLAPVSLSPRAVEVAQNRKHPCPSWYLDLFLLRAYWGKERAYHHTAPVSSIYGLHEALRLVLEEGLPARWERHKQAHLRLCQGLEELGLEFASEKGHRLWQLNAVKVPEGVDEANVRKVLLERFGIEIGAGLGPLRGKIWRIGLMGENARISVVERLLEALGEILHKQS